MGSISARTSASLLDAVIAKQETQNQLQTKVLKTVQDIAKAQGEAAVELIESAASVIDVRV